MWVWLQWLTGSRTKFPREAYEYHEFFSESVYLLRRPEAPDKATLDAVSTSIKKEYDIYSAHYANSRTPINTEQKALIINKVKTLKQYRALLKYREFTGPHAARQATLVEQFDTLIKAYEAAAR